MKVDNDNASFQANIVAKLLNNTILIVKNSWILNDR